MITTNDYCRAQFGEKVYKLSLSCSHTCPTRDGSLGTRGCIFCSAGGSGDFAESGLLPVSEQIELAKARVAEKFRGGRFIAYFQAFTSTYAPIDKLREAFFTAASRPDIAAISIATRPDCLGDDVLSLIAGLEELKPVWVELGLQTIHESTAEYIRRGWALPVFDEAVEKLGRLGVHTIVHVILGLPGETREDMLETVSYAVRSGAKGIKLQLLHVLEGTDLALDYRAGRFSVMDMETYVSLVCDCLELLPEDMVVHRLTGDGPKKLLIAPQWSADKKRVINALNNEMRRRGIR